MAFASEEEAWAAVGLLAMTADGMATSEEHDEVDKGLERIHPLLEAAAVKTVWKGVLRQSSVYDRGQLLSDACNLIPVRHAGAVYAMACDVVLADGVISPEEEAFLAELQTILGLEEIDADRRAIEAKSRLGRA